MPYLLLILGLIIGLYALYRFFLNAELAQVKAFFLMAILVVLCTALFTLAVTGRLPAAIAILTAVIPLAAGLIKARNQDTKEEFHFNDDHVVESRSDALEILGLDADASDDDIKDAYKKLMQKVHPDHEGSEWIAAKLNQARDFLLKDE